MCAWMEQWVTVLHWFYDVMMFTEDNCFTWFSCIELIVHKEVLDIDQWAFPWCMWSWADFDSFTAIINSE